MPETLGLLRMTGWSWPSARPDPFDPASRPARCLRLELSRKLVLPALLQLVAGGQVASATTLQPGFRQVEVFTGAHGLSQPMAVALAPDGRIFVAEKRGMIRVGHAGQTEALGNFADLSDQVHSFFDRGLMSIKLHPAFPQVPYLYALYVNDPSGQWGDDCPTPPGMLQEGCLVNGRLSRLEVAPDGSYGGVEVVMLEGYWRQPYPSHSLGDLVFRADGALCVSAGDGGAGAGRTLPGALRSQDDPPSHNGSVVCVDPLSGDAWPTNPQAEKGAAENRLVAHGLRNPFRMTARPGTNELWVGDVGGSGWQEVDRIADPGRLANFGWPCFEGPARQPPFDALAPNLCETPYADPANPASGPYFAYPRAGQVALEPFPCSIAAGASISGLAFYAGTAYPERFHDGLFFADFSRDCLWVMRAGPDGLPDPAAVETFGDNLSGRDAAGQGPVDVEVGPDGWIYLVYVTPGRLTRIEANDSPVGAIPPPGATPEVWAGDAPVEDPPVPLPPFLGVDPAAINDATWGNDTDDAMVWTFDTLGSNDPALTFRGSGEWDLVARVPAGGQAGITWHVDDPAVTQVYSGLFSATGYDFADLVHCRGYNIESCTAVRRNEDEHLFVEQLEYTYDYQEDSGDAVAVEWNWDFQGKGASAVRWRPFAFGILVDKNGGNGAAAFSWRAVPGSVEILATNYNDAADVSPKGRVVINRDVLRDGNPSGILHVFSRIAGTAPASVSAVQADMNVELVGNNPSQDFVGSEVNTFYNASSGASRINGLVGRRTTVGFSGATIGSRTANVVIGEDVIMKMDAAGITGPWWGIRVRADTGATTVQTRFAPVNLINLSSPTGSGTLFQPFNGIFIEDLKSPGAGGSAIEIQRQSGGPLEGNIYFGDGGWNGGHLMFNGPDQAHIWWDATSHKFRTGMGELSGETDGAAILTDAAGSVPTTALASVIRSIHWGASAIVTDGDMARCGPGRAQALNGTRAFSFSCADTNASMFYGDTIMPDGWDGGTLFFELEVVHGTTETITFAGDFSCQCRGDGEVVSGTWGPAQSADVSITTANRIEFETTGALTCDGGCAPGDALYWRYVVDSSNFSTNAALTKVRGVKMEYRTLIGDD